MENSEHISRVNQKLEWIEEALSEIKMHRDEGSGDWCRRIALRLIDYSCQLADVSDDWAFDQTMHNKFNKES